jgi:hypothetical protein
MRYWKRYRCCTLALGIAIPLSYAQSQVGREVAIPEHLQDGQEFQISLTTLLDFGKQLFTANWTVEEGQGRPLAKGISTPTLLSDLSSPLMASSTSLRGLTLPRLCCFRRRWRSQGV